MNDFNHEVEDLKRIIKEPDKVTEEIADTFVKRVGKFKPIRRLRRNQILTALIGATGLALFLVGVEKVFYFLSGWQSITLGLLFLIVSGALYKKL